MKLEVGKYYRTRDGRKIGPLKENQEHGPWFFFTGNRKDDTFRAYSLDGECCGDEYPAKLEPSGDLISEWTDTPEVGTLDEIGAKVGDVVVNGGVLGIGETLTLTERHVGYAGLMDCGYRIISRAPTGPVITETVTRKKIVPGVYGRVMVTKASEGFDIFLEVHSDSRTDLLAAIATLQQIAEALED